MAFDLHPARFVEDVTKDICDIRTLSNNNNNNKRVGRDNKRQGHWNGWENSPVSPKFAPFDTVRSVSRVNTQAKPNP